MFIIHTCGSIVRFKRASKAIRRYSIEFEHTHTRTQKRDEIKSYHDAHHLNFPFAFLPTNYSQFGIRDAYTNSAYFWFYHGIYLSKQNPMNFSSRQCDICLFHHFSIEPATIYYLTHSIALRKGKKILYL